MKKEKEAPAASGPDSAVRLVTPKANVPDAFGAKPAEKMIGVTANVSLAVLVSNAGALKASEAELA